MKKSTPFAPMLAVDHGEEIAGMWVTPTIPEVGAYKLLAKRKRDGTYAWVHFLHRVNGEKKELFRGELASLSDLEDLVGIVSGKLCQTYGKGMSLQNADYDAYSIDGRMIDDAAH